MRSLRIWQAYN